MGIGRYIAGKIVDATAEAVVEKAAGAVGAIGVAAAAVGVAAGGAVLAAGEVAMEAGEVAVSAAANGVEKAKQTAKSIREKAYGVKRASLAADANSHYVELHKLYEDTPHKYEVFDAKGALLFYADEFQKGKIPDVVLYNTSNKIIGAIKRKKVLGKNILEVSVNGSPFGRMETDFHLIKDNYDVSFNDWTIKSDLLKGSYSITNLEQEKIATMHYQKYDDGIVYAISVLDSQNIIVCAALAIAIDECRK